MALFRRPSLLACALLAAGLVVFISAGRWQYGKAVQKEAERDAWQVSLALAARPAQAGDWNRLSGYDRVVVRGEWLPQRYLLDNQIRESRSGVEVYAPLRVEGGPALLVSLGWLPYSGARREPPALAELPTAKVELTGMLTPPTAHGLRLGRAWSDADGYPKLMPYFALDEIAADAGVALDTRVLRAQPAEGSPLQQTWHPVMSMPPERHRAYAWQWWSLAIAIVVVFLIVHRRARPSPRTP